MRQLARPGGTVGLILPTLPQGAHPSWDIARVASEAESAGADALWACDHLAWHSPVMEAFTALSLAAATTSQCALGTGVLQLPLRPAPLVAKTASSIQLASGGRFILGVGVGVHEGEFDAVESDFHTRGKRAEESIIALRRLWSEGVLEAGVAVGGGPPRYRQEPRPEAVPVWIGGSSSVARRRAARLGDGWMPLFVPADELRLRIARLRDETEASGRGAYEVVTSIVLFVACGTRESDQSIRDRGLAWMSSLYGLPPERFARHIVAGSAASCAEVVGRFRDAGVQHVVLYVTDDEPVEQFSLIVSELET